MARFEVGALACAAACAVGLSVPAQAQPFQVVNGSFITPTGFNGFEGIGPHAGTSPTSPWSGPYTEGGITVQSIGGDRVVTTYQHDGLYSWYDGSGQNIYTKFTTADGGPMNAFQFDATTQLIQPIGTFPKFYYQLLRSGNVVATGGAGALCDTINVCFHTYGFQGGLFDEVRLQTNLFDGAFNANRAGANVMLFDNIKVREVPEPTTWALMLLGLGAVGYAMRRRPEVGRAVRLA